MEKNNDAPIVAPQDFAEYLDNWCFEYTESRYYYRVGYLENKQGWILHISCLPKEFERVFDAISPILLEYRASFQIVRNRQLINYFNSGSYSLYKVGKIFTIFLERAGGDLEMVKRLVQKTREFRGPAVITDFKIGNVCFIRYGSYDTTTIINEYGEYHRVILNGEGEQVVDMYTVPAQAPSWVNNPFEELIFKSGEISSVKIHGKYYPKKKLKSDIKGDVIKCAYFKGILPAFCVIKQGRIGMFHDQYGRDMQDLLLWQYRVAQDLKGKVRIPGIFDQFIEQNTQCIAMDFVDGRKMANVLYEIFSLRPWFSLGVQERVKIFDFLSQILKEIEAIHREGYIHRDVTGYNFLVVEKEIYLIDLELVYSQKLDMPNPPFVKGTEGFMSPNQETLGHPEYADDIYAFGALMVQAFCGGQPPSLLIELNFVNLVEKLEFTIKDNLLIETIIACLQPKGEDRLSLGTLASNIQAWQMKVSDKITKVEYVAPDRVQVRRTIEDGLRFIVSDNMTVDNFWYSYVANNYDRETYPLGDKHVYSSIHKGVAGVMHFLFEAKRIGYDITAAESKIGDGWQLLAERVLSGTGNVGGLHFGSPGIGLLFSKCLENGFIKETETSLKILMACFSVSNANLNIIRGNAGDGLAMMQSEVVLGSEATIPALINIADDLIGQQEADGSWRFDNGLKVTGFGYGIAGIIYYLLEHGTRYNYSSSLDSAQKGLKYLGRIAVKKPDYWSWSNNDKSKDAFWWCQGGPGIALTFLKAFEVFKEMTYLQVAEKALRIHPENIVYHNLSQCHGLSGLGEIYLEAFRVTGNPEWMTRADWITGLICSRKFQPGEEEAYWLVETTYTFPTADLMMGCSGILHYLMRWLNPEKLSFPLLPEPW